MTFCSNLTMLSASTVPSLKNGLMFANTEFSQCEQTQFVDLKLFGFRIRLQLRPLGMFWSKLLKKQMSENM